MSKLFAQHGPAKGQKISNGLQEKRIEGAIFSIDEEEIDKIKKYIFENEELTQFNTLLDPQFYLSTFDCSIQKKTAKISCFPNSINRRDWRTRSKNIMDFLDFHANESKEVSNLLITPGFYIDGIDWHFDYSVEIFNHCVTNYDFNNYALSLLIHATFFQNRKNLDELLDEIKDVCQEKDYVYFTVCYDDKVDNNYDDIDATYLANILSFIYQLRKMGFKVISGYSFMNSILYSALGCEYICSGWFNSLRKFQKKRLEISESFGIRKKRYTSIPLLSFIMYDDVNVALSTDKITMEDILSGTSYDYVFKTNPDRLSFVDLEQEYWEALTIFINEINNIEEIKDKIDFIYAKINQAVDIYKGVIYALEEKGEATSANKLKISSKHLLNWKLAIDLFREYELMI